MLVSPVFLHINSTLHSKQVNLINGPYSCILPPILYSIFGTCIHSSIGWAVSRAAGWKMGRSPLGRDRNSRWCCLHVYKCYICLLALTLDFGSFHLRMASSPFFRNWRLDQSLNRRAAGCSAWLVSAVLPLMYLVLIK